MEYLLKFSAINLYFIQNRTLLERGENSFMSRNVLRVDFDPQHLLIRAKVHASMKTKTYSIQIYLTDDFKVKNASCECPRGLQICHHIAAAMFATRYQISKTDIPCSWVPVPNRSNETQTCREVFNLKKPPRISERNLHDHEIAEFWAELRDEIKCGFVWLLNNEQDEEDADDSVYEVVADVKSILSSNEYKTAHNPIDYLRDELRISSRDITKIASATVGHHLNVQWFFARRFRITASNFGALILSIKRNRYSPSLFDRLVGQKNLDGIKAIQWGRTHEKDGIRMLEVSLKKRVEMTGVWLSKSGVLGASPDGLVDEFVVEVKCRYKSRNTSLRADLTTDTDYVIWYNNISNVWVVNEEHENYHQIQGQIHLCDKKGAFLVVWTPAETAVVFIEKKNTWIGWLAEMENFCYQKFIPYLGSNYVQ